MWSERNRGHQQLSTMTWPNQAEKQKAKSPDFGFRKPVAQTLGWVWGWVLLHLGEERVTNCGSGFRLLFCSPGLFQVFKYELLAQTHL